MLPSLYGKDQEDPYSKVVNLVPYRPVCTGFGYKRYLGPPNTVPSSIPELTCWYRQFRKISAEIAEKQISSGILQAAPPWRIGDEGTDLCSSDGL